jgi:predicted MFS family arabinose efflux permease
MLAFAGLMAVIGILSIFFLKESPKDAGLLPDNKPMTPEEDMIWGSHPERKISYRAIFKTRQLWTLSIGWGGILIAITGFLAIAVNFMMGRGLPLETAILGMSIMGIVSFCISVGSGFVDQKIGPMKTIYIVYALLLAGLLIVCVYGGGNAAIIVLGVVLTTASLGAFNNLYASQMLSVFGPDSYIIAYPVFCCITSLIHSCGPAVAGFSLANTGGYLQAAIMYTIFSVVGFILVVVSKDKRIVVEGEGIQLPS